MTGWLVQLISSGNDFRDFLHDGLRDFQHDVQFAGIYTQKLNRLYHIYNKCILLLENTYFCFYFQIIFGLTWHILSMALWHLKDLKQPFLTFLRQNMSNPASWLFYWLSLCFFLSKKLIFDIFVSSPFWLSDGYQLSLTPLKTSTRDDSVTCARGQGGGSLWVFLRVCDVSVF